MAELILPNSFVNGTKPEAAPHAENFEEIADFVNGELLLADGSVAMMGPLRVPNPRDAHDLVNKQYADALGTSASGVNTICRRANTAEHGPQIGIGAGTPTDDAHAIPRSYVDSATSDYSSGWTTLTLLNGCTSVQGHVSLRYRRFDGVVHLVGTFYIPSLNVHVATLPSGHRPPGTILAWRTGGQYGGDLPYVNSSGQLKFETSSPGGDFDPLTIVNMVFPAA